MKDFFNKLNNVWYAIVFIVSLIIWFANVNNRLLTVEAQQTDQKVVNQKITSIESQISSINTSIEFIKDRVK